MPASSEHCCTPVNYTTLPGRDKVFKKQTISVNIKTDFFQISELQHRRAISSVVERFLHTEEAAGSIPASPTNKIN
jgi:hypothetical protein